MLVDAVVSDKEKAKIYSKFIRECIDKTYSDTETLHKHHIVPKSSLKSRGLIPNSEIDSDDNIILLSLEDHITAHELFSNMYEINTKEHVYSVWAVQLLKQAIKQLGLSEYEIIRHPTFKKLK